MMGMLGPFAFTFPYPRTKTEVPVKGKAVPQHAYGDAGGEEV
jgi:hypothetical protein